MDTSEQYTKMCEKAVEIQGLWNRDAGDFFTDGVAMGVYDASPVEKDDALIWLPRQDQLQVMTKYPTGMSRHLWFSEWIDENFSSYDQQDAPKVDSLSLEQLWLAFVMKEKFNKTWNGEDWV